MKRDKGFDEAVEDARRLQGWTVPEIADQLGVSVHAVQSWLKPGAASRRIAPPWAVLALHALTHRREVTERRGALEITYAPARTSRRTP